MKLILSLLLLFAGTANSFGKTGDFELDSTRFGHWLISDTINPSLPANQARVTFEVGDGEFVNATFTTILKTSVNGVWKEMKLDAKKQFSYLLEPGKTNFQFYVNNAFSEISIPDFQLDGGHDVLIGLSFFSVYNRMQYSVDKPVIYLSSDKELEFSINVLPKGEFTFTYPRIEDGWKGTTNADGSLSINGENYPYLFWESKQQGGFHPSNNGYKVTKSEILSFLEKRCDELGFTLNQKTDFITYWGPRMMQFDELFVQFHLDEACNQFAELEIQPKPDHINRVYISISPWSDFYASFVNEVTLPSIVISGFTLTEWGGFQFEQNNQLTLNR